MSNPAPKQRSIYFEQLQELPLQADDRYEFAAAHALRLHRAEAIYTYIPKIGCTTLRSSLARANGLRDGPAKPEDRGGNVTRLMLATNAQIATARYAFVFLRCPWRRLASLFLDKAIREPRRFRALCPSIKATKPALVAAGMQVLWNIRGGFRIDPETFTFRKFVALLQAPGALMAEHHWAPQKAFLIYREYDDVFTLERAAEGFEKLRDRIEFDVYDARGVSKHGTDQVTSVSDGMFADTPVREINDMIQSGRAPTHAAMYDDSLRDLVARLYGADIELYKHHCRASDLLFT